MAEIFNFLRFVEKKKKYSQVSFKIFDLEN